MNTKSPFSLYDFLGYMVPGIVILYLFQLFQSISGIDIPSDTLKKASSIYLLGDADQYIKFISMAYIIGHVVNYLSSITIEKFSIWMFGYPAYFLLNKGKPKYLKKDGIKLIAEWLENDSKKNIHKWVKRKLIHSRFRLINNLGQYQIRSSTWRLILWLLLLPISILDFICGKIGGLRYYYTNQMDTELAVIVKEKYEKIINGHTITNHEFDFQRVINHYYYEKYDNHKFRFDNYVALFGFARALSLIFCFSAICFIFYDLIAGILFLILSYVFFMAFMKFYRRFSLESYMCLIVDSNISILVK